jgi:hypothetical protein
MEIWVRKGREMSTGPNPYKDILNQCVVDADEMGLGGVVERNHDATKRVLDHNTNCIYSYVCNTDV